MKVRFWGVRGSIPSAGKDTVLVGGNTTCVEVRCGDELIILDTGTGIRNLGKELEKNQPVKGRIFFSHLHWDHIQGFPFFEPLYDERNEFEIFFSNGHSTTAKQVLSEQMKPPCFPVTVDLLQAKIQYKLFSLGEVIEGKNYRLSTAKLYHPNGSYAYRIESQGRTMVFATDTEHHKGKLNKNLLELAQGVDLLIYDAQYTEAEYNGLNGNTSRVGWGHSTMPEAVKMAKATNARNLVLFHHDPSHDDDFIKKIESEARELLPGTIAAYEGLEIDLNSSEKPKSLFY